MESHGDKSNSGPKISLGELSDDELFERIRQTNHSPLVENKQSLTEYLNDKEEDKNQSDVSGNDSTENPE